MSCVRMAHYRPNGQPWIYLGTRPWVVLGVFVPTWPPQGRSWTSALACPGGRWDCLTPQERTAAIYTEIRRLKAVCRTDNRPLWNGDFRARRQVVTLIPV